MGKDWGKVFDVGDDILERGEIGIRVWCWLWHAIGERVVEIRKDWGKISMLVTTDAIGGRVLEMRNEWGKISC